MRRMENRMESMENRMRGDMRTQRGEMQSMGLSLQASLEEVKGKMADEIGTPRGGTTEPRRSVECVRPAMETGEVGTTRDAAIIKGETGKLGHEGMTEELKEGTETQKIKETTEMKTETWELEEVEEKLHETKHEHTHT